MLRLSACLLHNKSRKLFIVIDVLIAEVCDKEKHMAGALHSYFIFFIIHNCGITLLALWGVQNLRLNQLYANVVHDLTLRKCYRAIFRIPIGAASQKSIQPSNGVRIAAEYDKVVAELKKAGEKALQVQALNELGDVYGHMGNWVAARQAWNDSLDLLIGPYQVMHPL